MRALVLHTANILGFRLPLNLNLLLASIGVMKTRNIGGAEFLVCYGEKNWEKIGPADLKLCCLLFILWLFLLAFLTVLSFFLPVYSSISYNSSVTFLLVSLCSFAFIKRFQYLSYLSLMQFL